MEIVCSYSQLSTTAQTRSLHILRASWVYLFFLRVSKPADQSGGIVALLPGVGKIATTGLRSTTV